MIRPLEPKKDMERVADMWLNEIVRVYNFVTEPEKFWRKRLDEMKKVTRTAEGYVYEEDGLIKAFVTLKDHYIWDMVVDSQYQKNGIGTALLNFIKERTTSLALGIFQKNQVGIEFFEKRGFVKAGLYTSLEGHQKFDMTWRKEDV
ncbi:MAG TPA: GNAT family N-acetyltransferase [Sedimentisphaerales bacterium]|nr:GNAT family N-acetyltransferase [Sedimentisphaerales bacterium]